MVCGLTFAYLFSVARAQALFQPVRRLFRQFRQYNELDLFPVRHTVRGYSVRLARHDLRAALNVALLAFPQGMAYALIAGLPIHYGIYGSAVATVFGSLFARSPYITVGPTNATAVILLSSFATLQVAGSEKAALLPLLVFMVGMLLILAAYFRAAAFVQFISRTVVTGYITAAAILIMANQVKTALGFGFAEEEEAINFFEVAYLTFRHLPEVHGPTVVLSVLTAALYITLRRYLRTFPNVALTLVVMALVGTGLNAIPGWQQFMLGGIDASTWQVTVPPWDPGVIRQLSSAAVAIALLCILEGTAIGKSLAARSGSRLDTNQEIFSMGMANVGCAFFSGMPASGSLTRSVLAVESGARTPLSSLYCGLLVAALALAVGPLIAYVPKATLAVLVIFIGISLINRHQIRIVTNATLSDRITFFVTFLTGMLLALDTAVYVGAITSIVLFLRKVSRPEMVEYKFDDRGRLLEMKKSESRQNPEVSIVHVEGELFFGAAELFRDQIRRISEDPNLRIIVLKMRNAHRLDASAMLALEELLRYMRGKERHLIISEARKDVVRVIKNSGLLDTLGRENLIPDVLGNPTLSTAKAMRQAKQLLEAWGEKEAKVTIYVDEKKFADEDDQV